MIAKLVKKLLIFCIPFVAAVALFVAFEPYDYWLFKGESWYSAKAINSSRRILSGECENILLGNSLTANLNEEYIEQVSGIDYDVLAYGGASLNESIEEFWAAAENNDLKRVVFGVNFYTMNDNMAASRIAAALETAEKPLEFIGDFGYWVDALRNFKTKCLELAADVSGNEALRPYVDDPSAMDKNVSIEGFARYNSDGERQDIIEYSALIEEQSVDYSSGEYIRRLGEVAEYCDRNNIELTFIIYNCNHIMWERVIYRCELEGFIAEYKDALKSMATVYDFEFDNAQAVNDGVYLDGMHLIRDEKMKLVRTVFGGEENEFCEITTKREYLSEK